MPGSNTDHLANKRTFLAWVRTGIALMGFGFVIAKFQIFLHIIQKNSYSGTGQGISGDVMIVLGIGVILYGLYDYLEVEKEIDEGKVSSHKGSAVILSILTVGLSIVLILLVGV